MKPRPPGSPVIPARLPAGNAGRVLLPYLGVTILYGAITLGFFAPALPDLGTRLIGDGNDNLMFAWNAWWLRDAVATGQNPYFCPQQFAPFGVPLVLHTFGLLPTGLVALLSVWLGLPAAYNGVVMAQFPLAGLCACALARRVTRHWAGAVAAGVVFMLCPFFASKTTGHFNLQWAATLPLFVLCLLRGLPQPRGRWSWLTALVLLVMLLGNVHTVIFAANIALWYFLYRGLTRRAWRVELTRFWRLLRPGLIVVLCWTLFVGYYAVRYDLEAAPYRSLRWMPEPLNYVLPLYVTSRWRALVAPPGALGWDLANLELAVYVGWAVLPLALAGWVVTRRRRWMQFIGVMFAAALLLSLGTKLQWHRMPVRIGGVSIALPLQLYEHIPVLGIIGQSGRYFVIAYLAMAVGIGALVAAMGRRLGGRAAWPAAIACIAMTCADYAFVPMTSSLPVSPIPPGPGRVLDPRLGNSIALYWQTQHQRPLVGGYVARIPPALCDRYAAHPGVGWFFERPDERGTPPSPQSIRAALEQWEIRYVCVAPQSREADVLTEAGLQLVYCDARDAVYVSVPSADSPAESRGKIDAVALGRAQRPR